MISESVFASQYTSLWRTLTPSMEEFVRRGNMTGYQREWPPIPATDAPANRRGVVNEAGFILFSKIVGTKRVDAGVIVQENIDEAFAAAAAYVSEIDEPVAPAVTVAEKREAIVISGRLYNFFTRLAQTHKLTVAPRFKGSGIIFSCTGDVMVNDERLWEVKSGDRPFRSVDYRQLAIYCALKYAETGTPFSKIALINPRRGTWIEMPVDVFAREVAGQSAVTLCQALIEVLSVRLVSL